MRDKPPIPWYHWAWWMVLLAGGLVVFYGIMTPLWMGIRAAAWVAERGALSLERRPRGKLSSRG